MKISLAERRKHTIEFGLIYGSITLFILLVVHITTLYLDLHHFLSNYYPCIFKRISHLPCPTCGGTRATIHLAHLRLLDGFLMNPMVATVIIVLLLWGLYSLITFITKSKRIKLALNKTETKVLIYFTVSLVFINWLYLIFISKP